MPYKYDLKDIDPKEVSLVDRPAIKRKFLIIKSLLGGQNMPKSKDGTADSSDLASVLKNAQSAIEKLTSLESELETMQKSAKDGDDGKDKKDSEKESELSKKIQEQLKNVSTILQEIITKSSSSDDKTDDDEADALKKIFSGMEGKLDALLAKSKKEETGDDDASEEEDDSGKKGKEGKVSKKKKDDKGGDDQTTEEEIAKKMEDFEKSLDEKLEAFKKSLGEESVKALGEESVKLVELFKEAAKEQFGDLFDRVGNIETALGGGRTKEEREKAEKDASEYNRTYGMSDDDSIPQVDDEANPFHSVLAIHGE